jgi:NAD(P)-dependent dehydrogenase (short-subunit alcohol dehydrogenase family)
VVVDINPESDQKVVKHIKKAGGEAIFLRADLSLASDAERMVQTSVNSYGKLDILFNNKGIPGESWDESKRGSKRGRFFFTSFILLPLDLLACFS